MVAAAPSTPRLSEVARHLVYPEGIARTNWTRIKDRLSEMAVEYDGWQQGAATIILGLDENGRYAATVGGVTMSLPRQVGKTFTVGSLLVAMCLEFPGLRVVWTSHHLRTTTNTFRSMQGMVRRKRIASQLAHNGIRTANGEQEIRFANGSIIMFGARERGFGVGIDAIDILVCDEAQRLSSRALADMVPTTNQARHEHGALVFFIGTPPRPTDEGDEFLARRTKALDGRMVNGVYVELSADEDGDYDDPKQWRKANASYPHRTPHESMLRLRENLTDDADWRREAMGVWDKPQTVAPNLAIPPALWTAARIGIELAPTDPPESFALAMSPDRTAWIGVAVGDHVELAERSRVDDTEALCEWLAKRCGRRLVVMIDARDPAASLVGELRRHRVKVNVTTIQDMGRACGVLSDALSQERLTHLGQADVDTVMAVAQKSPVGKAGAWEWSLTDPDVDTAPLRAITLARFGLSIRKRSAGARSGRVVTV